MSRAYKNRRKQSPDKGKNRNELLTPRSGKMRQLRAIWRLRKQRLVKRHLRKHS